jgi:ubiquinone/menaquinone biosynthesis C-methylase UbiE
MSILRTVFGRFYPTVPMRAKIRGLFQKGNVGEPPPTLNYVGGAEYSSGKKTLQHLIEVGGLRQDDQVLDVGCGVGRVAIPMKDHLADRGAYWGFDIVESGIDWCTENLKFPNFQFTHVDVYNLLYNPTGKIKGSQFTFPYPADRFTFVFANSVFTHMLPENTARYLCEIGRVSKSGMRGYITFFLLNDGVVQRMAEKKTAHRFPHAFDGYRTLRKRVGKEGVVAYEEGFMASMMERAGLRIQEIKYGSWSVDSTTLGDQEKLFQDVVLVTKP